MRALSRIAKLVAATCLLAMPLAAAAQEPADPELPDSMQPHSNVEFDSGPGMYVGEPYAIEGPDGEEHNVFPAATMHNSVVVPDGNGNEIWIGADTPMPKPNPAHEAARELKLKVRELADQMLGVFDNEDLRGTIAIPVSFVNQDDFTQSSSFGRYIAEQMFYEFNQRGFPVREYRLADNLSMDSRNGEFLLTRSLPAIPARERTAVILVGTYYYDRDNVFVNARLISAATGMVLRTGLVVLGQTKVTRRMLNRRELEAGTIAIKDFKTQTQGTDLSDIDQGYDVR